LFRLFRNFHHSGFRPQQLAILYTDPGGKWSLAEGVWKNESKEQEVVAYRWNEDNDHAKGTWFVLPKLIADAFLLQLIPE